MKKANTKEIIIEKATDLFYKHGFVKASIRDIVRSVGVTNSTVYFHFKNKDEILYCIIEDIGSVLLKNLRAASQKYQDPVDCLREMIFKQVCLTKEKRKELKIYMEEQYQLQTALRNKAIRQHRQLYDIYYNKICEILDKGLGRQIDKTVMTFGIIAMVNWAYRWFIDNGRLSIEDVAEHITHVFFSGILKDGVLTKPSHSIK
jgi:AcrR family transcriptional regulator